MPFYMNFKIQEFNNLNFMNMILFNDMLNNLMTMILSMILIFFFYMKKNSKNLSLMKNKDSDLMELFWTLIPSILILNISIPSMTLLFMLEEFKKPSMDLKIMGNQWYWTYIYQNMKNFNSYIFPSVNYRCMSVDNSLILPSKKNIRMIFSSNDVIHSWALPSLMIKMDCVPGRLNSINLNIFKSMKMKGQCSEICGMNHSFMPISIISLKFSLKNQKK